MRVDRIMDRETRSRRQRPCATPTGTARWKKRPARRCGRKKKGSAARSTRIRRGGLRRESASSYGPKEKASEKLHDHGPRTAVRGLCRKVLREEIGDGRSKAPGDGPRAGSSGERHTRRR